MDRMEKSFEDIVGVGVNVMIVKDGRVLLGRRKGAHGEGEYAFPGGLLEYMESFEQCAHRETLEECGIEIKNIKFQFVANVKKYSPLHIVHISLKAEWRRGEPRVLEPDMCVSWRWYDLKIHPSLFLQCAQWPSTVTALVGTSMINTDNISGGWG